MAVCSITTICPVDIANRPRGWPSLHCLRSRCSAFVFSPLAAHRATAVSNLSPVASILEPATLCRICFRRDEGKRLAPWLPLTGSGTCRDGAHAQAEEIVPLEVDTRKQRIQSHPCTCGLQHALTAEARRVVCHTPPLLNASAAMADCFSPQETASLLCAPTWPTVPARNPLHFPIPIYLLLVP